MAKSNPTTVNEEAVAERVVSGKTNIPSKIEWPHDQYGFTSMLRKEGVRAVGRIKADPAKLEVFIASLKVLGEYARTKVEDQVVAKDKELAGIENRRKAERARALKDQKAEVERIKEVLKSAEAALKAKMEDPDAKGA